MTSAPRTVAELEDRLSEPTSAVVQVLRACPGDVVVLGAGGKMGPSLTVMARRAANLAGGTREVFAVSRFSSADAVGLLEGSGVTIVRADLGAPEAYEALPDAPNVIYMAGQKFGTTGAPGRTWFTNTVMPAFAAARYRSSRIVAFSTGNVYALTAVAAGGSREVDPPAPVGEYAMSCLGRERVFEHAAAEWGTRCAMIRLNYAVDLRYGVLVDIAVRVMRGEPVDVTMGHVNCIWQGDANAAALLALGAVAAPPLVLNVTGAETLRVRDIAHALARRLGRAATIVGTEAPDALLSSTGKLRSMWGEPRVPAAALIEWVAQWISAGGTTSGKATRFEQREGAF
ncbi:MAG: NAD-dependent epimerase/dehydratase family protein [Gemmatimonadaceae bacterium]